MLIIEISKDYTRKEYNGDEAEAIKARDGLLFVGNETERDAWNAENPGNFCTTPHRCFNGLTPLNDTREDLQRLRRYMKDNAIYCKWYDIPRQEYITHKDITPERYPEITA